MYILIVIKFNFIKFKNKYFDNYNYQTIL